ncbi:LOW QUALITY PROTEIN: hypothetical protein MAR_004727 [Mya arenaria]|uniref:DUF6729 domain-containing protein n=2 Tax=Mya arenaria TaxID=6604 RepID=A0ABY7F0J4_MYAAR|nr:LOW QUALITY PROTEIN: hypothetical protein MAR_004727 [Mya arenaria]
MEQQQLFILPGPPSTLPKLPASTTQTTKTPSKKRTRSYKTPEYIKCSKFELRDERALCDNKFQQLIYLWEQLPSFEKKKANFPRRYTKKQWSGKFRRRRKHAAPGVESITKVLLGPNRSPAQWPNCNRYTEATCEHLLRIFPGDQKRELVGVQYLYDQTGQELLSIAKTREQLEEDEDQQEEDSHEDEGFVEMPLVTPPEETALLPPPEETAPRPPPETAPMPILHIPSEAEYRQMTMDTVLGPDNIPGYDKVLNFAKFLVELRDERNLCDNKVQQLIYMWEQLSRFEKKRTNFPRRYTKKQWSGKFGGRRKHVAPGSSPRTQSKPSAVAKLQQIHRGHLSIRDVYGLDDVLSSGFSTTSDRYNKEEKEQEHKILLQGKDMPKPPMTASGLPDARQKPVVLPSSEAPMFTFQNPAVLLAWRIRGRIGRGKCLPIAIRLRSTSTATNYASTRNHNAQISCHNGAAAIVHPSWTTLNPSNIISINNSNNKNTFKKRPRSYKTPEYIKCSKCGQNRKKNLKTITLSFELRDERALCDNKFQQLIYLWEQLPSFEKKRTNFPRRYTKKQWSGKFRRRRKHVAPGVESITKLSSPRTQSKSSAVAKLQQIHRGHLYNKEEKEQEHKILLQGKDMPKPPMTASGLPEARQKPVVLPSSEASKFTFQNPAVLLAWRIRGRIGRGKNLLHTANKKRVVDVSTTYLLASEYLQCPSCKRKVIAWNHNIICQLDIAKQHVFPCILTSMKACDLKVVRLLRERGLGNSSSQIQKKLHEGHSEDWISKTAHYLSDCMALMKASSSGLVADFT